MGIPGRPAAGRFRRPRSAVPIVVAVLMALVAPLMAPLAPVPGGAFGAGPRPLAMGPAVAFAASDGIEDDEVQHPRRAVTEAAFQRLKDALVDDYPTVAPATLHFVDVPIANAWVNQLAEVYVATGLLDLLQTEEQIAGVLAHELAHVTQQHVPKQIQRNLQWFVLLLAVGLIADRHPDHSDQNRILGVLHPLIMYAYSREAELEADQVALHHMERAGYHPRGLLEALELLHSQSEGRPVEELWMTHPLPEIRLGALRMYVDPRMGIPPRQSVRWDQGPVAEYDDPVDAAAAFLHATWADPDSLPRRARTLPPELQPDGAPGLYPTRWPDGFTVRPLGAVIEREEQDLLAYVVEGHLDLMTPLGVAHTPSLRMRLQLTARGWQVDWVDVVRDRDGEELAGHSDRYDETSAPPPGWDTTARAITAAVAQGNDGLWDTLWDGQDEATRTALEQWTEAARALQAAGFTLFPEPPLARAIPEGDFSRLAPEDWEPGDGAAAYVDTTFAWRLEHPDHPPLRIRQRAAIALLFPASAETLARAVIVPLPAL